MKGREKRKLMEKKEKKRAPKQQRVWIVSLVN